MTTGKQGEINVTPMIDVLLVLIIIFMIIIPQRSTGLASQVPQPSNQKAKSQSLDIVVSVGDNRSLSINSEPVAWAELDHRLLQISAQRPGGVLFVDGSPRADFEDVARVLDTARGAGIYKVALLPKKR
ncbi:MAG TPA: biopolymer transporter ExbD [Bryobacteraceae bacterium]|nr:biopolymer transporter ExbD [Bryobacteraceae bacterium]